MHNTRLQVVAVIFYLKCVSKVCGLFLLGEMRNDLYITLEKGEFEKGGKSVARNVQITMVIVNNEGHVLKVILLYITSSYLCFHYYYQLHYNLLMHKYDICRIIM